MSLAPVLLIEVAMNTDDGTYRLQIFRYRDGEAVVSPDDTAAGQQSIPEGLRAIADEIERRALVEFLR